MALQFHPEPGTLLMCDFSSGFLEPEMVKKRPVIVVSPKMKRCSGLATVVPLSTVEPTYIEAFHVNLDNIYLPQTPYFQERSSWIKCDMIYRVGFHRLNLIQTGKNPQGKRLYFKDRLPAEVLRQVNEGILHSLNLGQLAQHLR